MKEHADTKRRAYPSQVKVGDTVLTKQNKLSTRFDPVPFEVVRKKGTMITASRNGKYITRNASHFKVIDPSLSNTRQAVDSEEDDDLNTSQNIEAPPPQPPPAPRRSARVRNPPQWYNYVSHANT